MNMSDPPTFDLPTAHRYFSAECFNTAWDLIEKPRRTAEEDLDMLHRSLVALWHWSQRPDCTPTNRSIGCWQVSRVYAILGQEENARRYGELCLAVSREPDVPPFYLAYAHEALARAALLAGDIARVQEHLAEARRLAQGVTDGEEKSALLNDLETVR
jgi:hypothetical protein